VNINTEKTLEALLREARDGKDAFQEIFDRTHGRLFTYARSHTRSREDAMDIVQETFIDLWKALPRFKYQSDEAFYGLLFKILKRKLARYYNSWSPVFMPTYELPEESFEMEQEDYRYLIEHVNELPEKYRDVLKLRYWSDMKFGEIASVLKAKETTVKVWHHRALKELQVIIKKYEYV